VRSALAATYEMKRRSGTKPRSEHKVNDSFDLDMDPRSPPENEADNVGHEGSQAGDDQAGASAQRSTPATGAADRTEPPTGEEGSPKEPSTRGEPFTPSRGATPGWASQSYRRALSLWMLLSDSDSGSGSGSDSGSGALAGPWRPSPRSWLGDREGACPCPPVCLCPPPAATRRPTNRPRRSSWA
jgi:hypothetical protein